MASLPSYTIHDKSVIGGEFRASYAANGSSPPTTGGAGVVSIGSTSGGDLAWCDGANYVHGLTFSSSGATSHVLPDLSGTLVTTAANQILSNKTLLASGSNSVEATSAYGKPLAAGTPTPNQWPVFDGTNWSLAAVLAASAPLSYASATSTFSVVNSDASAVTSVSTDGTMTVNSDASIPTQKAVVTYAGPAVAIASGTTYVYKDAVTPALKMYVASSLTWTLSATGVATTYLTLAASAPFVALNDTATSNNWKWTAGASLVLTNGATTLETTSTSSKAISVPTSVIGTFKVYQNASDSVGTTFTSNTSSNNMTIIQATYTMATFGRSTASVIADFNITNTMKCADATVQRTQPTLTIRDNLTAYSYTIQNASSKMAITYNSVLIREETWTATSIKVPTTVVSTTSPQLTVGYDGSNYATFSTSSGGVLKIAPTGGTTTVNALQINATGDGTHNGLYADASSNLRLSTFRYRDAPGLDRGRLRRAERHRHRSHRRHVLGDVFRDPLHPAVLRVRPTLVPREAADDRGECR